MPHKQKRKKGSDSDALYDLPPTHRAKPLPAYKNQKLRSSKYAFSALPQEQYRIDDTPKAFARLLAFQTNDKRAPKGLDDGEKPRKSKLRVTKSHQMPAPIEVGETQPLQIQPGEKLSDFSLRVDQALPMAGISTSGKKCEGIKERRTKHEKHLRKLQEAWRKEDARLKEVQEEERERVADEWEERLAGMDRETKLVLTAVEQQHFGGKSRKKKKGRVIGEIDEEDYDPWAVLKHKRDAPKGVFDVVQAPPKFDKLPREVLKQSSKSCIPQTATLGSSKRKEELGKARADIISNYRSIMASKFGEKPANMT